MKNYRFDVLEGHRAVEEWLDLVRQASDNHRNEFGFVPRAVFDQAARRGNLFVLLAHSEAEVLYAGHLMFDRAFPRAHVRQMFTLPSFRRQGAASVLLDYLRKSLVGDSFISIYARVAEDLIPANAFWQRQQFYVQRSEKGGETRNRQILVRCHELQSPQLFPTSGINEHDPLGLLAHPADGIPMFLLDLNVLFDLKPRRLRREDAVRLVQAERMNFCRLAVSVEVREELQRTRQEQVTDPMEAVVDTFPCFPVGSGEEVQHLVDELAPLVFPHVDDARPLTPNERSDLRHLVTAIHCGLSGLVTNDGALLNAGKVVQERYGVRVQSPASLFAHEISKSTETETAANVQATTLRLTILSEGDESSVRALLTARSGLSAVQILNHWLPPAPRHAAKRYVVWSNRQCVGYVAWPAWAGGESVLARAIVDESNEQALEVARMLLLHLLDHLRTGEPRQVRLELPDRQSHLREVADGLGFRGGPLDRELAKFALGRVLTPGSWRRDCAALCAARGPKLPADAPTFRGIGQQLALTTPTGNRVHTPLDQLETLLSPTLLCLANRPAVITPIKREYAEPLLGHSPQESFLPSRSASLFADRLYVSSRNTFKHFKRGTLILFYESRRNGGGAEIVAIARVVGAYLKARDDLSVSDLQPSVLTTERVADLGKSRMKTITVFDNIFPLPHPVGLSKLKKLGCGASHDLLTTRPITDAQLQAILQEGFDHERQ